MDAVFTQGSSIIPCVSLTFDDGPTQKTTTEILKVLKKFNILATFFVTGENTLNFPTMAKRIAKEGHELGNHSFAHPHFSSLSMTDILLEIETTNKILLKLTKQKPLFFRPPYGDYTENHSHLIKRIGMMTALWSKGGGDWEKGGMKKIVSQIETDLQPGDIILLHDHDSQEHHEQISDALTRIIRACRKKKIQIVPLKYLYGLSNIEGNLKTASKV